MITRSQLFFSERFPEWLPSARRTLALVGLSALLGLPGCRKDTPPETKTETEAKAPPAPKPERRPPRPVDEGVEVPTEEDFEDAVEKQITSASNLQKELDQLEKQIQQP